VAGLGPMLGQANHFVRYAPAGQDYAAGRYVREAKRLLAVLDRRLREREYLADEYSIADIASYPWAGGVAGIGMVTADFPAVAAWVERVKARPAVARATQALMDETRSKYVQARPELTAQEWSNLFGEQLLANAQRD
jgi:GST-like protein